MPTEIVGTMAVSGGQKQTALLMPGAYPADKVTYNGTNVDDTLDEMRANNRGTTVDIKNYSSSTPYECPADGYVYAACPTSGCSVSVKIDAADGRNMGMIQIAYANSQQTRSMVYVRKGTFVYPSSKAGDITLQFSPYAL